MVNTYVKKPVKVEAIQFKGDENLMECLEFLKALKPGGDDLIIRTLEGDMKVSKGDYIIKGVNGEFYPCKPDIFKKTYSLVIPDHIQEAQKEISRLESDMGFMGSPDYYEKKKMVKEYYEKNGNN